MKGLTAVTALLFTLLQQALGQNPVSILDKSTDAFTRKNNHLLRTKPVTDEEDEL